MPVLSLETYNPLWVFKNGHINTIYPYAIRKSIDPGFKRERLTTVDDDFIDVDKVINGSSRLVILCHGLEGSSESKYILHTCNLLSQSGWDVICMNFRGCSGEMNKKLPMYHSGFTQDLHMVIKNYEKGYSEISLVGFSLGGNMILKYLGDGLNQLSPKIKSAVGVSVPCDLHAGAIHISRWQNKIYDIRFLQTLKEKVRVKKEMFPDKVDITPLKNIKTLIAFDDHFTAPIHGFKDATDYYARCHCKQFLKNIKIPSLIISAVDDPFLPKESYPYEEAHASEYVHLLTPRYGGHVGFVTFGKKAYWNEEVINRFIDQPASFIV